MNKIFFNQHRSRLLMMLLVAILAVGIYSCKEDAIRVATADEENYAVSDQVFAFLANAEGKRLTGVMELRAQGTFPISLNLTRATENAISGRLAIDPQVLTEYNAANGTDYVQLPENLVTIENNGAATVPAGALTSEQLLVRVNSASGLQADVKYVIPIKASVVSGGAVGAERFSSHLIFVRDLSRYPDIRKASGVEIISCIEVNDTNPLNNLNFTLAGSGKPLIDVVILFSSNINYNARTGKVYVQHNENVQHILDNKEKYLKPLKDRGMRVILSILGNHDRAGVANLSDAAAKEFARELKDVCDAYELDGVFFDDEYSAYINPPPPGFVSPSSAAASRLVYETKKVMPDKDMMAYVYSRTAFLSTIDGMQAGEYTDYGIHDYLNNWDLSNNYPGMPRARMAMYSQEFALNRLVGPSQLVSMRNFGSRAHMIFALDPFRDNFANAQMWALNNIATALFDDQLVYNGQPYSKDW